MKQDIRFVDLKTGNTFDGTQPYVFWVDGAQSVNLIYSKPICFISNNQKEKVSINENEIFQLIDPNELIDSQVETIYGFEYKNISKLKRFEVESIGTNHHNYFVHIIYIIASAKQAGEYVEDFTINQTSFKIGADFYAENEELYINLANNGVEIPEVIQKALYDVNVHEEKVDNITLNRKWKELLSNYWDVIANKGSYKSLYNSLKWFEYGDRLRLCEIWKDVETGKYLEKDIQEVLSDNFFETMNGFAKTTYLALYHSLETPEVEENGKCILDKEGNPKLKYISSKWSTQDLALKLCLLGNFYETYFLPIHLDLIHSTIEDVVYSNTFKVTQGTTADRSDFVYSYEDIKCNVKDGDIYRLNKVQCYVGPKTLFGLKYNEFKNTGVMIGVQTEEVESLTTNEEWAAFASQMYSDVGAIVDFHIQLPLVGDDKIKKEILIYKTLSNNSFSEWEHKVVIDNKILGNVIDFSLFCPIEGDYEVRLQFDSLEGKVFTKRIKFSVIDTNSIAINVYKVYNLQDLSECELGENFQINNYMFSRRRYGERELITNKTIPTQYIPAKTDNLDKTKFKWTGVCLNHLLIIHGKIESIIDQNLINIFKRYYFVKLREVGKGLDYKCYTVCISKVFGFKPSDNININNIYINFLKGNIYREDYIFVPEFHKLVELDYEKQGRMEDVKYYTVTDDDTLCVLSDLSYGKHIEEYDWEFINASKPWKDPIKLSHIKEPFITTGVKNPLEPGYYDIKFNYRLTNEDKINTIVLNSAFKKV